MIHISVEIREGTLTHRATLTAPYVERVLKSVEGGKPSRRVRLVFPIEPEGNHMSL